MATTVFGELGCTVLVAALPSYTRKVRWDLANATTGWKHAQHLPAAGRGCGDFGPLQCRLAQRAIVNALPLLRRAARLIADTLAADWFRLDVYVGHRGLGPRINEITYPSHEAEGPCSIARWVHEYRAGRVERTPSQPAFERVAALAQLDGAAFVRKLGRA